MKLAKIMRTGLYSNENRRRDENRDRIKNMSMVEDR
jgi:hypothetical protein